MLTIFSCPKPFKGHIDIIQRNALETWTRLNPKPQILIMGNEEGATEACRSLKVAHIPQVKRNSVGTPLMSSLFHLAQEHATSPYLCYVNGDIILTSSVSTTLEQLIRLQKNFLAVARRWGVDLKQPITFSPDWEIDIENLRRNKGKLEHDAAIDCFIFPKALVKKFPDFALGRPMWDNWFIYNTRRQNIPVIDCTEVLSIIHQNHDYGHLKGNSWEGPEADQNRKLAGGYTRAYTIADSDYVLTKNGLQRNVIRAWRSQGVRSLKTLYHKYLRRDTRW